MEDPRPLPRQLYETHGDAAASLKAFENLWEELDERTRLSVTSGEKKRLTKGGDASGTSHASPEAEDSASACRDYNRSILDSLSFESPPGTAPLPPIFAFSGASSGTTPAAEQWVAAHNASLALLSSGRHVAAAETLAPLLVRALDRINDRSNEGEADPLCPPHGEDTATDVPAEEDAVQCRCVFLLLDSLLAQSRGDALGLPASNVKASNPGEHALAGSTAKGGITPITVDQLLSWVELYINRLEHCVAEGGPGGGNSIGSVTELRFRLHLFKSRALFLRHPPNDDTYGGMKHDVKTRQARKELKSAMEIYQHKLTRWSGDESSGKGRDNDDSCKTRDGDDEVLEASVGAGSVGSLSDAPSTLKQYSGDPTLITGPSKPTSSVTDRAPPTLPPDYVARRLDAQGQCALGLKANLEYLKGNSRKAIKLCAEARLAGERRRRNFLHTDERKAEKSIPQSLATARAVDEAVHYNNISLIHHASGRYHAALQYYALALSRLESLSSSGGVLFEPDGTALPIPTAEILHNAALCAISARNFACAYECMARCIQVGSGSFGERPRCWLRMAEGCIGIHAILKQRNEGIDDLFGGMALRRDPAADGVIVDMRSADHQYRDNLTSAGSTLEPILGSSEDLIQVSSDPLPRAIFCLQRAMRLCHSGTNSDIINDKDCLESTLVTLAYVQLELNDPLAALGAARKVLDKPKLYDKEKSSQLRNTDDNAFLRRAKSLSLRRKATAQLYACEALCQLDNPSEAINILFGENSNSESGEGSSSSVTMLDDLACHLSSVPEDSPNHCQTSWERNRLIDALCTVHVSASGCAAQAGDLQRAGAHVIHAAECVGRETIRQNVDSSSQPHELGTPTGRALLRRAHLYCLLRAGNREGALEILRIGM